MKKISFVLIALLALVAFTGCPTMHDDLDLPSNVLPGLFWAVNGPQGIIQFEADYTVEFAATSAGWGASEGDMCFTVYAQKTEAALLDGDNWWSGTSYRFGGFDVNLNTKTECVQNGDNITVKGIQTGDNLKVTLTDEGGKVYITITKL